MPDSGPYVNRWAETDTLTVTVHCVDAQVLVLGPLDAAMAEREGKISEGGSVMRLRQAIARALNDLAEDTFYADDNDAR